jgi:hypothetical protein
MLPAQHALPGLPQALQVPPLHDRPDAVQKLACGPALPVPLQHGCPAPPQVVIAAVHEPAMHMPSGDEQLVPLAMQSRPLQHPPAPVHTLPSQHGWLAPPQETLAPLLQTSPGQPGVSWPLATHTLFTQQPPPLHWLPAQHGCPAPPHSAHVLPTQLPPCEHAAPTLRHWPVPGSQQPASQLPPSQHGWPGWPQAGPSDIPASGVLFPVGLASAPQAAARHKSPNRQSGRVPMAQLLCSRRKRRAAALKHAT